MKLKELKVFFSILFLVPFGLTAQEFNAKDALETIRSAAWDTSIVHEGLIHRYYHFDDLFNGKQSVTAFEIDLSKGIRMEITAPESRFIKTSAAGSESGAIAAINGSFFNIKEGGSAVFFKQNDTVIKAENPQKSSYMENAGLAMSKRGKVSILKRPEGGWVKVKQPDVLTSGPLMLYKGEVLEQVSAAFNTNRHPRTAIGITKDNRLIAVVVDGRNKNAYGMSIAELSLLMQALGCEYAMNLDGGGSSAAWIKGEGVVNYPSDNKLFDHEGERSVVTVILFHEK